MKMSTADLRRSVKERARLTGRLKEKVVRTAARGFVRRVIEITPPAGNRVSGTAAKRVGEAAINADTAVTMEPMSERQLQQQEDFHGGSSFAVTELRNKRGKVYLQDRNHILRTVAAALAFHAGKRNPSTGRPGVNVKALRNGQRMRIRDAAGHNQQIGRNVSDDIALVPRAVFDRVRELLKRNVGFLGAGWVAAADTLGVSVPTWIRRHGASRGSVRVETSRESFRITITNAVDYIDNVAGFERRVQKAFDYQLAAMQREAKYLLDREHSRTL